MSFSAGPTITLSLRGSATPITVQVMHKGAATVTLILAPQAFPTGNTYGIKIKQGTAALISDWLYKQLVIFKNYQ